MPFHKIILKSSRNREHHMIKGHTQEFLFFFDHFHDGCSAFFGITVRCTTQPTFILHQVVVQGWLLLLGGFQG